MSARSVTILCQGHPAIRATHGKTLEWVTERDLTERATCVLGVDAKYDADALAALRGIVDIEIRAGQERDTLTAMMSPIFSREEKLIVRRSALRQPRTLALGASKGAADIRREVVRELQKPGAVIEVFIRETQIHSYQMPTEWRPAVFVGPVSGNEPEPMLAGADLVIVADAAAARWLSKSCRGEVLHGPDSTKLLGRLIEEARRGRRVVIDSAALHSELLAGAWEHGIDVVPLAGLSAAEAALAMSGLQLPYCVSEFSARNPRTVAAEIAQMSAAGYSVLLVGRGAEIYEFAKAMGGDAERQITVLLCEPGPWCRVWRGKVSGIVAALEDVKEEKWCAAIAGQPTDSGAGETRLSAEIVRLITSLAEEGVTAPHLSRAVARAVGLTRQEAYAQILRLRGQSGRDDGTSG